MEIPLKWIIIFSALFFKKYIFIYLALLDLSFGTQDLQSSLHCVGFLVATWELLIVVWDLVPGPGIEPKPSVLGA